MARKVFLTVLGTAFYEPCPYKIDHFISQNTRYIQIATIDYLKVKEWTASDAVIMLLTDKAKETNWIKQKDGKRKKFNGELVDYITLQQLINEAGLPMEPTIVDIPEGQNEAEMWSIFQKLYSVIQYGDELYIDLTHSFRYIPMMMMVFSNYAKFLKGVKVKSVTYGNYEAYKNKEADTGFIVDITSLSVLQDWTAGADEFISSGRVDKLRGNYIPQLDRKNKESGYKDRDVQQQKLLVTRLDDVVSDLVTCRGVNIVKGAIFKKLHSSLDIVMKATTPEPFKPLLEKISDSFKDFKDTQDVQNGIKAARWCFDHKLYQQCITMLRETIDTLVCNCVKNDCPMVDFHDEVWRECSLNAYHNLLNGINAEEGKVPEDSVTKKIKKQGCTPAEEEVDRQRRRKEYLPVIEKMMSLSLWEVIKPEEVDSFRNLRNDINHCGMRNSPTNAKAVIDKIEEFLTSIEEKIKIVLA